ncbi:TNT domain-containing protein [Streptomyces tropicalis]|uniref:TNT domain-containing protein n=1 Tax=Streptomyces tropicalis TaxID=3034234 RepID=A0ABT6AA72_9ACTN|nr:TNT domain-containing protein [Streptomyces tropicalis]MDF3300725.1 TNT domain-containing protein [Streptomyces tropicalis]
MRALRTLVGSVLASLLLLVGTAPAAVHAADNRATQSAPCPIQHRSRGVNTAPPALQQFYWNDWRLGPARLPRTGAIGRMLRDYHRTDSVSPYWFLGCYWQTDPVSAKSGWWYPDNNGFVLRNGRPVEQSRTLRTGQLLDLFGSGLGHFLAPAGTPYAERAIPPSNLNTYDRSHPYSYHLYRVLKPFSVQAGPIRPWFHQPGLGLQYLTTPTIPDLVNGDFLKELPVV